MAINTAIIGATGYAGEVLIDILLKHPEVRISGLYAKVDKPQIISDFFPKFKKKIDLVCKEIDIKEILNNSELVYLALPHTVSLEIVPGLLKAGKTVIDLSADYRLKNAGIYQDFYKVKHTDKVNLKQAVYGLPELYRAKIKKAKLVANPGCYPTAAILGLAPVISMGLAKTDSIIIDAKSGTTGAGRKLAQELLFCEVNEDFKAYKINIHQHMPEINQGLSGLAGKKIDVTFVPHLLPINRGILETIYIEKIQKSKIPAGSGSPPQNRRTGAYGGKNQRLVNLYKNFYKDEPFVRVKEEGAFPQLKDVVGTNFCDIGIREEEDKAIIISVIDNLVKGASGQAVQNMNIVYGWPENTALI